MKIVKKALYSTLMLACATMITSAQAQTTTEATTTTKPSAVLFKIHEIKPVVNTEGVVTNCDFMVTFYNRTTKGLRPAKIEMGWTDNVSNRYEIDAEYKETTKVEEKRVASSRKQDEKLGDILTSVDMPSLGSYKQATVKASVATEKCFLLLDNVSYRVATCSIVEEGEDNNTSRRRSAGRNNASAECVNLFEYVDSSNPEYHDEFKTISFSEQERIMLEDRKQDVSTLENSYNEIVKNFEKVEKTISNIQ
jgi:hypothetical protein